MDIITLDFETYYADDYTLSKLSTEEYVRDPRFEMILVSLKINDGEPFWILEDRFRQFCAETDWSQVTLVAHHAHFDGLILSHHFGVKPAFWIDTLSMARVVDGPKAGNSLYDLCIRHGIGYKMDYVLKAKNKRLADFTRDELFQYGEYCCNDTARTYDLAQIFLPHIPEKELRLIGVCVRMFTEPVFVGDQAKLAQAVVDEKARKAELYRRVGGLCDHCEGSGCAKCEQTGVSKKLFSSSDKFADVLRAFDVEPPMKLSPAAAKKGETSYIYAFAKSDPGMQELLEDDREEIRFLAEARIASKSTIIETRAQRFLGSARRGPMPVYLKYGAAHTWRFGGGDKSNWQNMSSANAKRPEMAVLKNSVLAPDGHLVVRADASQIEARFTAWLAGQLDLVEAFAQGRDVYSETASTVIYLRPVDRKNVPEDYIPGQVGKAVVLGLGFGMGWFKFALEFLKGMFGGPPIKFTEADLETLQVDPSRFLNNPKKVQQVEAMISRLDMSDRLIHCIVVDEIVTRYRRKNAAIVKLWDTHNQVIDAMIEGREMVWGPGGLLRTEGQAVVLPNDMKMNYRDIQRSQDGEASYWNGRERVRIHGPKATENFVQALARIPVTDTMLEAADMGLKVGTMAHDEVVTVPPIEVADDTLTWLIGRMAVAAGWAPGLPLAAEGSLGRSYGGAKHLSVAQMLEKEAAKL